ncbi:MAG: hypothetical protein FWC00_03955 [Firmicutes bacterium]|nr:hypothetical protein [Bacillota bacterium]
MADKKKLDPNDADYDISLLERLMSDTDDENIFLFDAEGKEVELEQVAVVTDDDGQIYAVLHEVGGPEEEVLVFKIDPTDEESVTLVDDEATATKVLNFVIEEANKG